MCERWSGLVSLRTAASLTPSLPASSTLVMRCIRSSPSEQGQLGRRPTVGTGTDT